AAVAELPLHVRLSGTPAWMAWLGLHLVTLVGFRNRLSVFLNWAWNYVTWDRGPRLIIEPRDDKEGQDARGVGATAEIPGRRRRRGRAGDCRRGLRSGARCPWNAPLPPP